MISLSNDQLDVAILDPVIDRDRFGSRYCTGGYIFQITDRQVGELLSGPTYPDSFNVFDGQGIPDAFNRAPLRDPADPHRALIIGVGSCDLESDRVIDFCDWHLDEDRGLHLDKDQNCETDAKKVVLQTNQSLADYALTLTRTVSLEHRTVRSTTRIANMGSVGFPISWFPHPFFPQPEGDELCRLNIPVHVRENPGYDMAPSGFVRRRDWPWSTGHYLALDHGAHSPLTVVQRHPRLGLISGTFSYVPRFFPIWGNGNTFSWEPYFEQTVAVGQTVEWSVVYDF